jgi:hypothetical protein
MPWLSLPEGRSETVESLGVVTLGQVVARLPVLDVACNRCDRRGRLHTHRLIAEHGPDVPIPELRRLIAADCPRMIAGRMHDVCGVRFPGLSRTAE